MKFQRLTTLRQAAEGAPLPAALAVSLLLALLFQLGMPVPADLPATLAARPRGIALTPIVIPPVAVDPVLRARSMFAPDAVGGSGTAVTGTVTLLGVARARGAAAAVLGGPDGTARTLGIGGRIGQWTVRAIGTASVRIDAGDGTGQTLRIGQGTAASADAALDTAP